MQILSTRIGQARRHRGAGQVEAIVTLLVREGGRHEDYWVKVRTSTPARAPGAAALRDRLAASAKLILATRRGSGRTQSFAA